MNRYAITPSAGLVKLSRPVYVLAPNVDAAVAAAKVACPARINGYRPTGWPAALVTNFPTNASVLIVGS